VVVVDVVVDPSRLHLARYEHFMHIRRLNELQSDEFVLSISGPESGALNLD